MRSTIDLLESLRGIEGVQVSAPVYLVLDDEDAARVVAEAAAEQLRDNLRRGLDGSGRPLEPIAPSTARRHREAGAPPTRGILTGRLLESLQARPDAGGGYVVEPSADRAEASGRVYGEEAWDDRAMDSPTMRAALQTAASATVKGSQ